MLLPKLSVLNAPVHASHVGMNVLSCSYQSHIVLIVDMPSLFP